MSEFGMTCRMCNSQKLREAGVVEYIAGYAWAVFDCESCGCRFTKHDSAVHNLLHQLGAISYYRDYRNLAAESKRLFDLRDAAGLRSLLASSPKYGFVIREVEQWPTDARVLEIGCSRGYLTSCCILGGRKVLGVDVSPEAVEGARAAFGDHFELAGSTRVAAGAPYDLIYHVGMIGCVADPVGMTRQLLALLKPGGRLIFNAPNRAACRMKNQLWFDSAPPPDVVTLFPPGFWRRQFAEVAVVREGIEFCDADRSFLLGLRKNLGREWRPPAPHRITEGAANSTSVPRGLDGAWQWFERGAGKIARITHLSELVPRWPTKFGLFVKMSPRPVGNQPPTAH
jgi:SAM-dependent methyltransferase